MDSIDNWLGKFDNINLILEGYYYYELNNIIID